jgi:hypothetical protein
MRQRTESFIFKIYHERDVTPLTNRSRKTDFELAADLREFPIHLRHLLEDDEEVVQVCAPRFPGSATLTIISSRGEPHVMGTMRRCLGIFDLSAELMPPPDAASRRAQIQRWESHGS